MIFSKCNYAIYDDETLSTPSPLPPYHHFDNGLTTSTSMIIDIHTSFFVSVMFLFKRSCKDAITGPRLTEVLAGRERWPQPACQFAWSTAVEGRPGFGWQVVADKPVDPRIRRLPAAGYAASLVVGA